jgi:membrane-associated phospholipid phosphatase
MFSRRDMRAGRTMLLLLGLLAGLSAPLVAQQTAREAFDADFGAFFEDGWSVASAPSRFGTRDWMFVALTAGATAAAFVIDDDVRDGMRALPLDDWKLPLAVGEFYGGGIFSGGLGLGLIGVSAITGDDDTRITGRMVLQSLVYSTTITVVLKALTGRSRPFTEEGKSMFRPLRIDNATLSFPSGHTTAAFALSSTLSRRIGSVPVSILLYSLATLTATQRIAFDQHWLSDTVLGAVIGGVVGIAVVRLEEERQREQGSVAHTHDGITTPDPDGGFVRHRPLLRWSLSF